MIWAALGGRSGYGLSGGFLLKADVLPDFNLHQSVQLSKRAKLFPMTGINFYTIDTQMIM